MSQTVRVRVLQPLTQQGRSYVRGDLLTTSALEAAALARRGLVTLTRGATVAPAAPIEPVEPKRPRRTRGTYRRKDLVAEGQE